MEFSEDSFTEQYKLVIKKAQEEAVRFGEDYASTEHLLLGVLSVKGSTAIQILDRAEINRAQIRSEILRQITQDTKNVLADEVQFRPRAKGVFYLAEDEARNLDNDFLGTEHLLLALVRERDGMAGRVLFRLDANLEKLRAVAAVIQNEAPE